MRKLRMSRALAVFFVFLLFLIISGIAVWFVVDQGVALIEVALAEGGLLQQAPQRLKEFAEGVVPDQLEWLKEKLRSIDTESPEFMEKVLEAGRQALEQARATFATIFTMLSLVVLVPIYLYYFMLDLPKVWSWIRSRLPGRHRQRILGVTDRIHEGLSAFLRGRLVIAVLKGLLTAFGLMIVGVPYAFAVGMVAGVLSILPFIGAALGLVTSVVLVLVEGMGAGSLVGVVVVFVVAEAVEGYVFYPLIFAEKLDMHPVTMLFSVLAWALVLGFFGVLVAIPLTIIVRAIVQELVLRPLESLAEEEG